MPCVQSSSFFAPLILPSPRALHGVGTVTQRSNWRQVIIKTWNVTAWDSGMPLCFVLPLEPKVVLEPEELRETTCWSKNQGLQKTDSFSCANKCELGWRAAHISIGCQSPWWSRPEHFTHSGGTVGAVALPACSGTLRATWLASCFGEQRLLRWRLWIFRDES